MVYKIVLTGGNCGGKATAIQRIMQEFVEKGYKVVVVPEAATLLINSGIRPFGNRKMSHYDFQKSVIGLQLKLEKTIYDSCDKDAETIMLCDRGIFDTKPYVGEKDFKHLMREFDLNELDVSVSYDMVLHLRTMAFGKEEFYTLSNKFIGVESIEEAREFDQKILESWAGHAKLRIIGNDGNFEDKLDEAIREIYSLMRKPLPVKKHFKYLVDYIDIEKNYDFNWTKTDIQQYCIENSKCETIYRMTMNGEDISYKAINKIDNDIDGERIFLERGISSCEYFGNMPQNIKPVNKIRYSFEYQGQYCNLDFFDDFALLEIKCTDNKTVNLPSFIHVIEDVTEDVNYQNLSFCFNFGNKGKVLTK